MEAQIKTSEQLAQIAKKYAEQGDYQEAWKIAEMLMEEQPHKANPLILASFVSWKMQRHTVAYHLGARATQIAPHEPRAFIVYGVAAQELWLSDEAEMAYKMAFRLAKEDADRGMALMNLSALCIDTGKFADAEKYGLEALKFSPNSSKAKANVGFGKLGQRKWDGWDWYSHCLGLQSRLQVKFGEEPDWDGSKGKVVALYGEQGLGDEISFASVIPDAIKDCKKLIVECDPKLTGLYKRSFPQAKIYGTRKAKASDGVKWDEEDWKMDASLALGELGKFYRRSDESFTGEPYLVPDPDRRAMWRTLFDRKQKPCIGIAWTGGIPQTGAKFRALQLEELKSFMLSLDAHWVSLQYKDAGREISVFNKANPQIDLVQYGFATLTPDYDDTAAMVAELDLVICIQTAVAHLCGAIGKECWVMLPKNSQWRYGMSGETIPWYKSVRVFRQRSLRDWHGPIGEITGLLRKRYALKEAA